MRIAPFSSVMSVSLFLFVLAAGCRESVGVIAAHNNGKGKGAIYDASLDDTWKAAHIALRWDEAGTPEDHLEQGYIITNHPGSAAPSSNDQVGVWFDAMNPTKTRVSVVVMGGTETTAGTAGPDEETLQKDIAKALALLQSGQPIPDKRP
jgi:hypothetical protein